MFSRSALSCGCIDGAKCRLEQVKRRRFCPSCSHVATSGAVARSQLRKAAWTISPTKGISVPGWRGRSLRIKAYILAEPEVENIVSMAPFSFIYYFYILSLLPALSREDRNPKQHKIGIGIWPLLHLVCAQEEQLMFLFLTQRCLVQGVDCCLFVDFITRSFISNQRMIYITDAALLGSEDGHRGHTLTPAGKCKINSAVFGFLLHALDLLHQILLIRFAMLRCGDILQPRYANQAAIHIIL